MLILNSRLEIEIFIKKCFFHYFKELVNPSKFEKLESENAKPLKAAVSFNFDIRSGFFKILIIYRCFWSLFQLKKIENF